MAGRGEISYVVFCFCFNVPCSVFLPVFLFVCVSYFLFIFSNKSEQVQLFDPRLHTGLSKQEVLLKKNKRVTDKATSLWKHPKIPH